MDTNKASHKCHRGQLIRPYESFTKPPSPYLSWSLCSALSHTKETRAAAVDAKEPELQPRSYVSAQDQRGQTSRGLSSTEADVPASRHADVSAEFIDSGKVFEAVNDKYFDCRISFRRVCGSTAGLA